MIALPSGTVTFVFTDIEGSTRLLRDLGDAYDELVDLHNGALRGAWEQCGGVEVNTEGDAFFVAFADADDALAAVVDAQRRLAAVKWPHGTPVRVRMGMHTGYARPVDTDYRSLAVNQAARVVAAANGGQILLTADTFANLRRRDASVELSPLGRYRVRDFDEPVALYAVSVPDLPRVEALPRVRPAEGHNLVMPTASLVGRADELGRLQELVGSGRLVTVTGPGGVGKTRLVTELALRTADEWTDGVWFVDLAPVSSTDVIASTVATAVGLAVSSSDDPWTLVLDHLRERHALLILDNCEHLVSGAAWAAMQLLEVGRGLGVLATSRTPLGLRAESVFRLGGLTPEHGEDAAVELFAARSGIEASSSVSATIAELCRELDNLPLAIELAAARATAVAPEAILERIRSNRSLLTSRDPGLPARHRSLDLTLDWSYQLLDVSAAALLRGLAVFAGSFDLDAATDAGAAAGAPVDHIPELLWSLVDSSLVQVDVADSSRYVLLRSVRANTRARSGREEQQRVVADVAKGYVARLGPQQAPELGWLDAMRADVDNIREVVNALARSGDEPAVAQMLAWSIAFFHDSVDSFRSGVREVRQLVELLAEATPQRVGLLTMFADLHMRLNEIDDAEPLLAEAELLASSVGQPPWDDVAIVRSRGMVALRRGDPAASAQLARAALLGTNLARSRVRLFNMLGIALLDSEQLEEAVEAFRQEVATAREADLTMFLVNAHGNLAEALQRLGFREQAAAQQLEAMELARSMGGIVQVVYATVLAAHLLAHDGDWREAVRLQSAADVLLEAAEIALFDSDLDQRRQLYAGAHAELDDDAFATAAALGRSDSAQEIADVTSAHLRRIAAGTSADPLASSERNSS